MLGVHHTDGFGQVPEDSWIAEVQDWGHVVLQDPGELAAHPGKKLHEGPDGLLGRTALPSALKWIEPAHNTTRKGCRSRWSTTDIPSRETRAQQQEKRVEK